jgi:hypothetical protein
MRPIVTRHSQPYIRAWTEVSCGETRTPAACSRPAFALEARDSRLTAPRDAFEVAAELSARLDARLYNVLAHGGKGVDRTRVIDLVGYHREDRAARTVGGLSA